MRGIETTEEGISCNPGWTRERKICGVPVYLPRFLSIYFIALELGSEASSLEQESEVVSDFRRLAHCQCFFALPSI
jgi:hypothetical protein